MDKNMGKTDRTLRLVLAVVLAAVALTGAVSGWLYWAAILVAVVMAVTALVGNCPAYSILGIKTCTVRD
ncbi:YgaP family membrane protein [Paracoccus jeotgali]|uniref:DUF2892 domain-containing protein n=1 Tax=Paracoccus jeotgali TaxID=2065379 RepID=A0A2K9MEB4_9RHOB|nr:DUF2892 domain-containing protein [Paracoccus jeotgali]AUM73832.1 DUF2892 domain-containing protein [Paracoccus jeotgali]